MWIPAAAAMPGNLQPRRSTMASLMFYFLLASLVADVGGRLDLRLIGNHWPYRRRHDDTINCRSCSLTDRTQIAASSTDDVLNDNDNDIDETLRRLTSYHQTQPADILATNSDVKRLIVNPEADFNNNVDNILMSFPYCYRLTIMKCRKLHQHLERLVNTLSSQQLVKSDGETTLIAVRRHRPPPRIKRGALTTVTSGGLINHRDELERENDAKFNDDGAPEKFLYDVGDDEKRENTMHVMSDHGFDRTIRTDGIDGESATEQVLQKYRLWRQQNGYGQQNARWGRSTRRVEIGSSPISASFHSQTLGLISAISSQKAAENQNLASNARHKRSLVVEIQWPSDDISDEEKDMLDAYLTWREQNGYGALAGRWG